MNKHYPHLADKLPAPSQKLVNNRSLILRWWAREDSNLQPSGYEPRVRTDRTATLSNQSLISPGFTRVMRQPKITEVIAAM
jgi:hypothetical protein